MLLLKIAQKTRLQTSINSANSPTLVILRLEQYKCIINNNLTATYSCESANISVLMKYLTEGSVLSIGSSNQTCINTYYYLKLYNYNQTFWLSISP